MQISPLTIGVTGSSESHMIRTGSQYDRAGLTRTAAGDTVTLSYLRTSMMTETIAASGEMYISSGRTDTTGLIEESGPGIAGQVPFRNREVPGQGHNADAFDRLRESVRRMAAEAIMRLFRMTFGEEFSSIPAPSTGVVMRYEAYARRTVTVTETITLSYSSPQVSSSPSPIETAERILSFALTGHDGGDRRAYAAMVADTVMHGVRKAEAALGVFLPPAARETLRLIREGLAAFAAGTDTMAGSVALMA